MVRAADAHVKGAARSRQVRTMKTNASKPLMTCRKRMEGLETGVESQPQDKPSGYLPTGSVASGMKVA
jgi:hypothetical protein